MLEELYMRDLANAMKMPEEVLPAGKVTVSGPQVETQPKQPEMGTITGIPQTAFEKALETSGIKLSELGDMIDQSAPGTLNTLLGREIPVVGNLKLRDFLPFVGSKDDGKLTGTPAALIAAGTGQPLRGQPVVSSTVGPDGRTYFSASGSPAMLNEDVGTAVVDVATLGLGKPLAAGAKKAVKATKNMPVGMSTKAVGQGMDELGFYSAAKQAVDAIQQPKGIGQQFLKQIEKTPGVKPDEIKWTGLDEFLKSKKSVTKAEVQEYLDKNRVEIKEVQLRDPSDSDIQSLLDDEVGQGMTRQDAIDYLRNDEGAPKFSKYTLPGGENYREILLTLPATKIEVDKWNVIRPDGISDGFYSSEQFAMDRANAIGGTVAERAGRVIEGGYMSPHFDQPNILAHIRVNDRVIDGKKTLFVEEVQSDWHQAGRKKGYNTPEKRAADQKKLDALDAEREQLRVEQARLEELAKPFTDEGKDAPADILDKWNMVSNRLNNLQREYAPIANQLATGSGVPDAPFKTTWSDLSMKRVIQMASEGGYDRIAFTTGKTQAERYDLSKQIEFVRYRKTDDGKFKMTVRTPEQDVLMQDKVFTPEALEDTFGKELSEKIIKGEGKPNGYGDNLLTGLDLSVGGEGMKGFYDDILPKFLNKYAKKWDAKAGVTEIKVGQDKVERGMVAPGIDFVGEDKVIKAPSVQVNYIDVTPKMRESVVTKGQPMFAIGAGGAGAAATQEENK